MLAAAALLLSLITAAGPGESDSADSWPGFRGAKGDGVSDYVGLVESWPQDWPQDGPPVLWHRELGPGYSSFAADGERAYTQTQSLYGQYVLCLDLDTGKELWRQRYDWPFESAGMYPGPRATPTVFRGRVYFCGTSGLVGCLDAETGKQLWAVNLKERYDGRGTDFGYSCSPVVYAGKVLLPVGGAGASVVALDANTGKVIWRVGDQPASYCSILPIRFGSTSIAVAYMENSLCGVEIESGRMLFEHRYSHGYNEHAAVPVYREPYLMVMAAFKGGSTLYRLKTQEGDDGATGVSVELVRSSDELSNDVASSVLVDGFVYGFDLRDVQAKLHRPSRGTFRCVELESGEVRWSSDEVGHANVIAADGKLILFNDRGELILARARPDQYEELARTQVFTGEICWTSPALHRGRLLLRTQSRAACIYLGDPFTLKSSSDRRPVTTAHLPKGPVVDPLAIAVGGERRFPFDLPDRQELWDWYLYSLAVLSFAALTLAIVETAAGTFNGVRVKLVCQRLRLPLLLAVCIFATPVLNRYASDFVFTWPAAIYLAFQSLLTTILHTQSEHHSRRQRWHARLAGIGFLALCGLYFHFCQRLGLAMESVFLIGLLPGFPIATLAAYRLQRDIGPVQRWLWTVASISACYWGTAAFIGWRATHG